MCRAQGRVEIRAARSGGGFAREVGVLMRETRALVRGAKSGVRCRAEFLEIGAFGGLVGAGLPSLISAATWRPATNDARLASEPAGAFVMQPKAQQRCARYGRVPSRGSLRLLMDREAQRHPPVKRQQVSQVCRPSAHFPRARSFRHSCG